MQASWSWAGNWRVNPLGSLDQVNGEALFSEKPCDAGWGP